MFVLGQLLILLIQFYIYLIIFSVIVSWLIAFNVLSSGNQKVRNLLRLLDKCTAPVFDPVRRYVPTIGGIDISPIIVIFGLMLLQNIIMRLFLTASF
tara:strand:- start:417 stop:707 length:291 start_codon:yes stop_codon:yes gene_type:complete